MKKGSQTGFSLVWVLALLMMISCMVWAMAVVSAGYYKRGMRRSDQRQAYYTARSVAQTLAREMTLPEEEESPVREFVLQQLTEGEDPMEIEGLEEGMGQCYFTAAYEEDVLSLSVDAEKNGQICQLQLVLKDSQESSWDWKILSYREDKEDE